MVTGVSGYDLIIKEGDLVKTDTLGEMSCEGGGLDLYFCKPRNPGIAGNTRIY